MIQEIWLESGLDLSEGTQSINLSTDASRKNLLVTTLPQIPSPLPEAMTLNHVRLLYRCIYAHPQTACLALCLAQISFTCGEANISRSVNLMHYRAIWSDTYFQWEFTFIISAWRKVWATPTAKICKHSVERKSPTKYRYPTRWRTLYSALIKWHNFDFGAGLWGQYPLQVSGKVSNIPLSLQLSLCRTSKSPFWGRSWSTASPPCSTTTSSSSAGANVSDTLNIDYRDSNEKFHHFCLIIRQPL